jgi:hypothetical protein
MTTQYKWLPSEPTDAIIESMMLKTPVDCDISEVWLKGIYKAIWEAAPDNKPLSEQAVLDLFHTYTITNHEGIEVTDIYKFADAIYNL